MKFPRTSGVLAHPSSFPGAHGIGDLGPAAFRFLDWMELAGQRCWQIMPLNPTGYGDSPYASPSAFAGNPLLISLDWLAGDGLLDQSDIANPPDFLPYEVDFGRVVPYKSAILRRGFDRFRAGAGASQRADFERFRASETSWLDDYALFMTLKDAHSSTAWMDWEAGLRRRDPDALASWRKELEAETRYHQWVQFQFRRQWSELKAYANGRAIQIIGDIPIFVAHDSADVWAHQDLFRLDADGAPTVVAGVPPDAFTAHGQRWGNPLFDWHAHERNGFAWWTDRLRATLTMVDIIRIDHFRGFAAAWSVPAGDDTAEGGRWERGPGTAVFAAMRDTLGEVPIIVEDLGLITPDVHALRDELGFPGMKVLQFAFGDGPGNAYLPHNYDRHCVAYSGTHDNQTTVGWFQTLSGDDRQAVQRYLGRDGSDIAWDLIRLALSSVAHTSIVPLQDVLRLGDEARMNTPGRPEGNWGWRYLPHQLHPGLAGGLGELTQLYGRKETPRRGGHDPFDYTVDHAEHPLHKS